MNPLWRRLIDGHHLTATLPGLLLHTYSLRRIPLQTHAFSHPQSSTPPESPQPLVPLFAGACLLLSVCGPQAACRVYTCSRGSFWIWLPSFLPVASPACCLKCAVRSSFSTRPRLQTRHLWGGRGKSPHTRCRLRQSRQSRRASPTPWFGYPDSPATRPGVWRSQTGETPVVRRSAPRSVMPRPWSENTHTHTLRQTPSVRHPPSDSDPGAHPFLLFLAQSHPFSLLPTLSFPSDP